tara:strand:+ start:369 stop:1247 length:879 start_codon:yes stop_codon:yes gene_type:complete
MIDIPNDKRSMDFGSAFAIADYDTKKVLDEPLDLSCLNDVDIINNFLLEFNLWIKSSTMNSLVGLDNFKYSCYSLGTSEAFDKFYMKNAKRRFRCFKGEYMYHKLSWRDKFDWDWLEEKPLQNMDAVVISLPFADTGDKHDKYNQLMNQCCELNVPVLVDCAYFGICRDIEFNLDYDCITDITFSLSKTFPVAYARIGMRCTRMDNDDSMFVYQKTNYNNKIGAALGLKYFERFTPDYITEKYIDKQLNFCNTVGVNPSKTVLFGIDYKHKFDQYNRGGNTNRLSFHKQYVK